MQHLESHAGSVILPEGYPTGHIRETVHMTASPCPAPFPGTQIIIVEDIGCRVATAGDASRVAAAAGNAPAFVFVPHVMVKNAGGNFIHIRNRHLDCVFRHKPWREFRPR